MASLLYKAFADTAPENLVWNPKNNFYFMMAMNTRFRREPKISRETVGNFVIGTYVEVSRETAAEMSNFDIAFAMRKKILEMDEDYIQSTIDKIAEVKVGYAPAYWNPFALKITNWNRYFDWYSDADLGSGPPERFGQYRKLMFRSFGFVKPYQKDGDIDITFSLDKLHMDKFLEHKNLKKYFQVL